MVYGPVLMAAAQFITYAQWVIVILLVYYIIKFITMLTDDGGDWEKRGENLRGAIKKQYDEKKKNDEEIGKKAKEKAEKGEKRDAVSPIKENIRDAVGACEKLRKHLSLSEREKAYHAIKELIDYNEKAIKNLQVLRGKNEGKEHEKISEILENLHAAEVTFLEEYGRVTLKEIKKLNEEKWQELINKITPDIKNIKAALGIAWKGLEEFHK